MECLHGKPALATTTKNGLFWYCGNKPSCQFFCPQKDREIFARAVTSFQASGCPQPVCSAHQRLAKMRVVKDNNKGNAGRPFFVCSDRNNPCSFWQWEMSSKVLNRYINTVWFHVYVKSRKMAPIEIACFTAALTIERTRAVSSNGKRMKKMILYTISVTFCFLFHPHTDMQSKVPERLSPVMKLIIKRLTTNIYRESLKIT